MVLKYVCDSSFCKSKGTVKYSQLFLEYLDLNLIKSCNRKKDSGLDINLSECKFSNYLILILYSLFNPSHQWVSVNNLPSVSFNKNNLLLVHNIFYAYDLIELVKNKNIIGWYFIIKWLYFRTVLVFFPPKRIYVQTKFMQERINNFFKGKVEVLPNLYEGEVEDKINLLSCKSRCDLDGKYIFFLGGNEPHKKVVETVNNLLLETVRYEMTILLVGDFSINDFSHNDKVKLVIKRAMSHIDYLKAIYCSSLCVISSKHESLCLPLLECQMLKKEYLVANAEYSLELSNKKRIFSDAKCLIEKIEKTIYD